MKTLCFLLLAVATVLAETTEPKTEPKLKTSEVIEPKISQLKTSEEIPKVKDVETGPFIPLTELDWSFISPFSTRFLPVVNSELKTSEVIPKIPEIVDSNLVRTGVVPLNPWASFLPQFSSRFLLNTIPMESSLLKTIDPLPVETSQLKTIEVMPKMELVQPGINEIFPFGMRAFGMPLQYPLFSSRFIPVSEIETKPLEVNPSLKINEVKTEKLEKVKEN